MKNYDYDYEWDKEYCYPESKVLINKLNIEDLEKLNIAEKEITALKLAYIKKNPIDGKFDFDHLKAIHRFLFEDIYSWAGEPRHVNISKGNQFCLWQNIDEYAESIFKALKNESYLIGSDKIEHRLAYYLSEINVLHPFREGNGRTQRLFIEYLAENAGYHVDFSSVTPREMIEASAESFACKYEKINSMFERITHKK